jgi:hypothetical protein
MLPIEFVVRGYLAGSGWKDYRATARSAGMRCPRVCGVDRFPAPIVTPATKACRGHDENIDEAQAAEPVRREPVRGGARRARALRFARAHAEARGIILADTKFELGVARTGGRARGRGADPGLVALLAADAYAPGGPQPSFDKQFVRDWCERRAGTRRPGARAPGRRRGRHAARYLEAFERSPGSRSRLRRRPGGRAVKATVLVRPKGGILDPQGEAGRASLRKLGFDVGRRGRASRRPRGRGATTPTTRAARDRAHVRASCSPNPLIESFEIRARRSR